jgi:hypothetical protein
MMRFALKGERGGRMDKQERERHLRELAGSLFFAVDKNGERFTLTRDVDVATPVRHENLTLDEAEEVLRTWKLRGFHGG